MKISLRYTTFLVSAAVLSAAVFAMTPIASAAELTPQEKKLIPAAKQEGAVILINPQFSEGTTQMLREGFIQRYGLGSGFKFNTLRKGTGAVVAQVRQEIQANKVTVDVMMVHNPAFFDAAVKNDAFLKLDSGQWKESIELVEKAGQYSNYPYVVVPNANMFRPVWNVSCPGMKDFSITSYADAVNPPGKGLTIASDLTKSSAYTNMVLSLKESGYDVSGMWKKLKATEPIVMFRTEPKMQTLITCQRAIDMWTVASRVLQNVKKQPALANSLRLGYYKEGHTMLGNQMAVIKGAPHPNAGKLLVEFLLSKEGADIAVEGEALYTFRKGYTAPPAVQAYILDLSKHKLIGLQDWVGVAEKQKSARDEWVGIFK